MMLIKKRYETHSQQVEMNICVLFVDLESNFGFWKNFNFKKRKYLILIKEAINLNFSSFLRILWWIWVSHSSIQSKKLKSAFVFIKNCAKGKKKAKKKEVRRIYFAYRHKISFSFFFTCKKRNVAHDMLISLPKK